MGFFKTPAEKKALSYARDHVMAGGEIHDKFERRWARKKARTNRRFRRIVRERLESSRGFISVDPLADTSIEDVRREQIWKWGITPLAEWVPDRLSRRAILTAQSFFGRPYDRDRCREPFAAFLSSLIAGNSIHNRAIATAFADLLERQARYYDEKWLDAFLCDAPEWKARLREWIAVNTK